ncbi:hypothetical protein T01_3967 [Trichinella spiralis]|uniref:Uncharacterized protein n=1 Tax=Trichinella spiralis TaxID=6334 RepID=A0A0V1AKP3_TRISP|nr:hypothetical protein T01_3967 [Trichinella spiralis]
MNDERIVRQMYIMYEGEIHRALHFRKELGWIVLPNLPYSPHDSALSDYHLFWSLPSVLHCVSFNNDV